MTTRSLTNEQWGFTSNCFVCESTNPSGLRIPFEHDDESGVVRATFTLDDRFSGAPSYVHGGVTLAVLDEAMAWATIALGGKFAVTSETTTKFGYGVRVGRAYAVEATLDEDDGDTMQTSARVLDDQGRPCVTASATFAVLGAAQAVDVLGVDDLGADASYLKD
ncbi:MAG: PaaI family thioesterase [Acidimicrobiales bacterium]